MTDYKIRSVCEPGWGWLEERIRRPLCPDAVVFGAEAPDGSCAGMAAFEQWTPTSVGVHVAIDRRGALALARDVLTWALDLRHTVWALVADGSRSMRLATKHFGFKERGRLPGGADSGRDLVLIAVTREEFYR